MKPTIVKENFFEKPDEIVELADKIEWLPPGPKADWPGVRSKNLCDILPNLNNHIISEVLKLYYGRDNIEVLDTIIQFHKIKLTDYKNHNKKHTRFHKDYTDIAERIKNNFPNLSVQIGGETGLDITPLGKDKSQILRDFKSEDEIYFYGDMMEEGQNDYLLAQAVLGRKGSIYAVKDYKETWDLLEQYEL